MKKLKPLFILAGTLIIGFFLGFFTSGYITRYKINTYINATQNEGFANMIFERIDPTDDQKEKLSPIIMKYSMKSNTCVEEYKVIFDSLRVELEPFLTAGQLQKLEKCIGCTRNSCSPKINNPHME